MIETHISIFDAIVLGALALSCLLAFFRGLVREILSLGAWIGAGLVTLYYFPTVAEKLQPYFANQNPIVAAGFATLGLYITALVGFGILNIFILKFLKSGDEIGLTDNLLGFAFGAVRGAFVISLVYFLATAFIPESEYPEWMEKSVTRPYVERGAKMLADAAPEYLRDLSAMDKNDPSTVESPWKAEQYEDSNASYNRASRQKLDRLIDSMDKE